MSFILNEINKIWSRVIPGTPNSGMGIVWVKDPIIGGPWKSHWSDFSPAKLDFTALSAGSCFTTPIGCCSLPACQILASKRNSLGCWQCLLMKMRYDRLPSITNGIQWACKMRCVFHKQSQKHLGARRWATFTKNACFNHTDNGHNGP